MTDDFPPELAVSRWFNTRTPLTLQGLRGRVVVLHAFQMLCPGCVSHALPQAEKLHRMFGAADVAVVGLHTVFEHHAAMTPLALEAFIHEYRLTFPIGVDEAGTNGPLPVTMERYGLRGTPTTLVIDRTGRLRQHHFGQMDDLALGYTVGALLAEAARPVAAAAAGDAKDGCDETGCAVPSR